MTIAERVVAVEDVKTFLASLKTEGATIGIDPTCGAIRVVHGGRFQDLSIDSKELMLFLESMLNKELKHRMGLLRLAVDELDPTKSGPVEPEPGWLKRQIDDMDGPDRWVLPMNKPPYQCIHETGDLRVHTLLPTGRDLK